MGQVDLGEIDAVADGLFAADAAHGVSLALVVMHRGEVVAERYGTHPATPLEPERSITAETALISWSMAKSVTHAAVGLLVGEGLLDPLAPAPVPEWAGTDRSAITLLDLLEMRSGLAFVEDYVDGSISNCIEMLFGSGAEDVAGYAAALPLEHDVAVLLHEQGQRDALVGRSPEDGVRLLLESLERARGNGIRHLTRVGGDGDSGGGRTGR